MYKNCVGNPIRIKFDNSVTIYLNKDEKAIEKFSQRKIISAAKYDLRATVFGDKYTWVQIPFEVDTSMNIREVRRPINNSRIDDRTSSVKALI